MIICVAYLNNFDYYLNSDCKERENEFFFYENLLILTTSVSEHRTMKENIATISLNMTLVYFFDALF